MGMYALLWLDFVWTEHIETKKKPIPTYKKIENELWGEKKTIQFEGKKIKYFFVINKTHTTK